LPASVRSMVERKIDQLGEEDRKLLAGPQVYRAMSSTRLLSQKCCKSTPPTPKSALTFSTKCTRSFE
jgi:hypothetical protein